MFPPPQRSFSDALQASVVIFVGFVVGSYGEVNFTTLGIVYGVLSSFFVALYGMCVSLAAHTQW